MQQVFRLVRRLEVETMMVSSQSCRKETVRIEGVGM